jgi:hypothetical protein
MSHRNYDIHRDGITVVPCPIHFDLQTFLTTQREFIASDQGLAPPKLALGGFGAMGTPTSFHHPIIRHARRQCYDQMFPKFLDWHRGRKLEMMFDRFSQRLPGGEISPETWHRDIGPHDKDDIIYGGWINLDPPGSPSQKFSCVPGNFFQPNGNHTQGFVRFDAKNAADIARLKAARQIVEIPPGHCIIFNQTLAHEVLKTKIVFPSYRLYVGWRITDSNENIYDYNFRTAPRKKTVTEYGEPNPITFADIIQNQACATMPSGQCPPMFGRNHLACHRVTCIIPFSTTLKPIFRGQRDPRLVRKYLPSLRDVNMMWEPYTEEDINILRVHPLTERHAPIIVEEENDTVDIPRRIKDRLLPPSSNDSSSSSSSRKTNKRKAHKRRNIVMSSSDEESAYSSSSRKTKKRKSPGKSRRNYASSTSHPNLFPSPVSSISSSSSSSSSSRKKKRRKTPPSQTQKIRNVIDLTSDTEDDDDETEDFLWV